jgi:putative sigma-54 modulation protein
MQVTVSARHGHLQPGDQRIIEEKVEKLRRLYDRVNAIEVTANLERLDAPSVEVKVSAEHAQDFVAAASAPTVIAALDLTIPKIEQQLRKAKEKRREHRATGLKHLDTTAPADEV